MTKTLKTYRFDDHTLQLIEELKVSLHAGNNSEVIRRALTLLKLAVDNQKQGGAVSLKCGETEREVVL